MPNVGPFSAQIVRALQAYGLPSVGVFNGTTVTASGDGTFGRVLAGSGSAGTPGIAGTSFTTTGVFWGAGPTFNVSVGGTTVAAFAGSTIGFGPNGLGYFDTTNTELRVGDSASVFNIGSHGTGNAFLREGASAKLRVTTARDSNGGSILAFDKARGTLASPAQIQSGDLIIDVVGVGYASTDGWQHGPEQIASASENWTNTGRGSKWDHYVVKNGTTAQFIAMTIGGDTAGTVTVNTPLKLTTSILDGVSSANQVDLVNTTNPQSFRIFNTVSGANSEFAVNTWSGGEFYLGMDRTGTGANRAINIHQGTRGVIWKWTSAGHYVAGSDNAYDIGASGASRPRNVYIGGTLTLSGGTLLATSAALTNGAAAQIATLLNATAACDPTKWIPINDNGTTRYIPAW